MDPELWKRVKEVFDAACELDPADRTTFLGQACRGSEEVRAAVDKLLASSDTPGDEVTIRVRRWACPDCGERLLTRNARRQLDLALGLRSPP